MLQLYMSLEFMLRTASVSQKELNKHLLKLNTQTINDIKTPAGNGKDLFLVAIRQLRLKGINSALKGRLFYIMHTYKQ